uniref:Glycophorin-A n=1 Tax=Castor canadensis TaxID=51338 RepID=A0A8B7VF34_CASCN|nr:glycophorin-A isoform X1 [Castor canadensis]
MQHVFMAMWEGMTKSIFNNILEQKKHKSIACDYKAAVPSSIASILDESDITTQETTVSVSPGAAAVTDGSISETSTWISSGLAASSQTSVSAVSPHPPFPETREQLEHIFSEPVIIVIVFGVMAGIFGTIFAIYACINQLTKKRPVDIQPPTLQDTDVPLSSVETGLPEQ